MKNQRKNLSSMRDRFLQFIRQEKLFSPADKSLLAVSGGVDSVVMCELFSQAGFKYGIAHCNFKLRGNESDADEKFVQALAERYKVKFYSRNFSTKQYAEERKISIQMAARELRYSFFEEVRDKFGYELIATAHHKSDVMETMLLNLTRGTGISGLHGILAKRGRIIRPLLFATKDEIETFANEMKIAFCEDSSNQSEKYQRNLVRKKIIPVLKELNPDVDNSFFQSAERIRGAEKILLDFTDAFNKANVISEKDRTLIPIRSVTSFDYGETILFELLRPFGFTPDTVTRIFESADATPGRQFFSATYCLTRDRKYFIIIPTANKTDSREILIEKIPAEINFNGVMLKFSLEDSRAFRVPKTSEISCLDFDMLKFPLVLRHWKEGDKFQPLGMKTKKKVSDFLIDVKMARNEKENISVLESENGIICLPSLRIDERFSVTEKTKRVLVINHPEE